MKDIAQQTGASGIQREMDDDPKGGKTGKQLLDHSLNPCFSHVFLEDGLFVFFLQMCDSQNISSKHSKGTKPMEYMEWIYYKTKATVWL